jgi:tetratricopeptide (TPR) repeat protein
MAATVPVDAAVSLRWPMTSTRVRRPSPLAAELHGQRSPPCSGIGIAGNDVAVRTDEMDRLGREINRARSGPPEAYAEVLERAVAVCQGDAEAARYLDVLELHSELAEAYDRLGCVEDALRHADVLAEQGYACAPDPRCRRAEVLTRHGRLEEAAAIWDAVAQDTPEDVWVYNNAGLEYGAIGEHEAALSWLTRALELAVRTGDPERLLGQLRDLRAASLGVLGRDQDDLQTAEPVARGRPAGKTNRLVEQVSQMASERREPTGMMPLTLAWLPADEYPYWPTRWPDLADSDLVLDEEHGGFVAHAIYCQRMERRLRELDGSGAARLLIAPLRAAELNQWVADHEPDEDDPAQLRARYAADMGRDPSRTIAWPPARNEPCWCDSGRKYKKCCGAPGSGEPR